MSECTHDCETCGQTCEKKEFMAKPLPSTKIGKMIAVMSGKGGVGKSMVTDLLAVNTLRSGRSVAVLDADNGRGCARRELGDEIGIGGIVEDGDQLRGERRQAQRQDQPRDRRVQHPVALLLTGNDMRRHESPSCSAFFTV